MDPRMLLVIIVTAAVALVGFVVAQKLMGGSSSSGRLRDRLTGASESGGDGADAKPAEAGGIRPLLERVSAAASKPFMPDKRETVSGLRKRLNYAGIYAPNAVTIMAGTRFILLVGGVLGGYALAAIVLGGGISSITLGVAVGGLVGYMAPTLWLGFKTKANHKALAYGLADALDLMVVCIEAGLSVDQALQRVGLELGLAHPAISRELGIAHMETRVGLSKSEALRNLGTRTGSPPLVSLASMLTQAERFGTSIADALRVQADSLRVARQHAAEEMAAKASVKMSFPLVLFIFPATFIVLIGPVVLDLMHANL